MGGAVILRRRYVYDGNVTVLKERACYRAMTISADRNIIVPRYEIIKGCRESGKQLVLFVINDTNAANWVSCTEINPLAIAFALDCVDEDDSEGRLCSTYLLTGTHGCKLNSGTNEANRVLSILNSHDGDLGKCNVEELMGPVEGQKFGVGEGQTWLPHVVPCQ